MIDDGTEVTVANPRQVENEGDTISLTVVIKKILGIDYAVYAPRRLYFEERSLIDIYEEVHGFNEGE